MITPQGIAQQFREASWGQRWILLLLTLFPLLAVSVHSGGSTVYTLLLLPALFLAWPAIKGLQSMERRWLFSLLLLFALALVSLGYSEDLKAGVEKLERYFRLASLGLVYLYLRRMRIQAGHFLLVGVVLSAISLGVQALHEVWYLHLPFAQGLYHKIVFGDLAMLAFALMLAAMLTIARRPWQRLLLGAVMLFALYASLMSATRGSWLILPLLVVVLAWLYRRHIGRRGVTLLLAAIVLAGVALAYWQPRIVVKPIRKGVQEIELYLQDPNRLNSWGARLEMWQNSVKIWRDNPWFGTGLGDFRHDSQRLVEQGLSQNRQIPELFNHAHSIYFDVLAALGLVGLVLLLFALVILPWRFFYGYWGRSLSADERFYALSGLLTVAAFAVFGLTEGWLGRNPFVNPYVIYLATLAAGLSLHRGEVEAERLDGADH